VRTFLHSPRTFRTALVCAAAALLPCYAFAQTAPSPTPNRTPPSGQSADPRYDEQSRAKANESDDRHFMQEAADGGLAEVELGQLAADKAGNPDVKQFGERMVKDHSQANDKLKQLAARKGVTLPASPSAKNEALKNKLSKLSGDAFDKAYMADMIKDHKKDVAAFQRESSGGQDPDVKEFASQTLPTLQDHLKQAQSVASKTRQSASSSSGQNP
jgi:putative membrane protein